jgi:PleD family two-component response regulator
VCALPGIGIEHARRRFAVVNAMLAEGPSGATITVGLARLQEGDSADALIQRADEEVSTARRRR